LTLLARLGLRAGEVAGLGLDDIDWRRGEIVVRGKANRVDRLPLPADVGKRIIDYLRYGRPNTARDRRVFITAQAPRRGLTSNGVSTIVGVAGRRAGLGSIGAHRLRHSAATSMLRSGASLSEIGQILRHRRMAATAIYAKVDLEALRGLGRPWPGEHTMTGRPGLREALEDYLSVRQAVGFKLASSGRLLGQFVDYLETQGIDTVSTDAALAWATLPAGASAHWIAIRISVVRQFAVYLHALDPTVQVPPPGLIRPGPDRATPYLYSDAEIVALLQAAAGLRPPLRAATYQTLIGLLAVSGIRVGEAIAAEREDLDITGGMLVVRDSKFGKSRLVLLHPTTTDALVQYLELRDRLCPRPVSPALFVSTRGTRLLHSNISLTFAGLLRQTGISRRSASCRPRIHDLRHGFAVKTLLDAYERGGDVGAVLPRLATHLGHADPKNTFWYLSAAPELMALAGQRLEAHLGR
jgi:integrase